MPASKRKDYRKAAEDAWVMFKGYGALRVVEAWGDDVPDGKVTDFRRAVKAEPDEKVVFSLMEWLSQEVRDSAAKKTMSGGNMKPPQGMQMPFDMKRMVYGGSTRVATLGE